MSRCGHGRPGRGLSSPPLSARMWLPSMTEVVQSIRPAALSAPQQLPVQPLEDAGPLPVGQAPVRGGRRAARLPRQVPPGDAGEQDEDDRVEADAVIHPRATALGARLAGGEHRLHRFPRGRRAPARSKRPPSTSAVGLCLPGSVRRRYFKPCSRGFETALSRGHRSQPHADAVHASRSARLREPVFDRLLRHLGGAATRATRNARRPSRAPRPSPRGSSLQDDRPRATA